MISTLSFTVNPTTKKGRFTDITDYSALGLDIETVGGNSARGLGTISFQGDVIYSKTTVGDPLINLGEGATFFEFDLELDANGEVAKGVYSIDYSVRIAVEQPAQIDIQTIISSTEMLTDGAPWLGSFLEAGNILDPDGAGSLTVVSAETTSGSALITVSGTALAAQGFFNFDITNEAFAGSWTYKGCTQLAAQVALTPDCEYGDFGTWTVTNETEITTQTISSLNATINYPSWTGEDPIVVTTLPYSNNRLATGTYSVTLTEVITQTEDDGLILQYTATCTEEFKVTCANSLCGLAPCIEALRAAHDAELSRNKISKYQVYVDNVNLYYLKAVAYQKCGEYDLYKAALADIKTTLEASGCDCGCCDEDALIWVENTSAQTITAIEQLQEDLQYRLFNGVPGATQDESLGVKLGAIWQDTNTGIEYRCSDPAAGAAVWEVYYNPNTGGATQLYWVNVTQTTGYDPSVESLQNNTGLTFVWDRVGAGTYTVTASANFFSELKTGVLFGGSKQGSPAFFVAKYESPTYMTIFTYNSSGTLADGLMDNTTIQFTIHE